MSSSTPLRTARAGRPHPLRLGSPVSCLFLTLLAANQAAARETPSLPYLKQAAPTALRFAMARVRTPAPPPLGEVAAASSSVQAPASSGSTSEAGLAEVAPASGAADASDVAPAEFGGMPGEGVASPDGAGANSPDGPAQGGVRLLSDRYAPPVRVEDLLPFFLPAEPARSRAEYELK